MTGDPGACPECGAPARGGKTCREQFEDLLGLEFEHLESYGQVHFFTVACYNLQHPSGFNPPAIEWLVESLRKAVEEGVPPEEIRRMARRDLPRKGKITRVPAAGEITSSPTRRWMMTVANIRTESAEEYTKSVRAWARAVLDDLQGSA